MQLRLTPAFNMSSSVCLLLPLLCFCCGDAETATTLGEPSGTTPEIAAVPPGSASPPLATATVGSMLPAPVPTIAQPVPPPSVPIQVETPSTPIGEGNEPSTPEPSTPEPSTLLLQHCADDLLPSSDRPPVLGHLGLDYWAINTPVDPNCKEGAENISDHILPPTSQVFQLAEYISVGERSVVFRAHTGGATTPGSGYPRSELQEWDEATSSLATWNSSEGRHTMTIRQSINHLPVEKAHVVAGQIHGAGDDLHVFRLEGSKLYVTDGDSKVQPAFDEDYSLGDVFEAKFVIEDDVTKMYYNGNLVHTSKAKFEDAHFKVGCYTQSACSGDKKVEDEDCDAYGEVEVFEVEVTHE